MWEVSLSNIKNRNNLFSNKENFTKTRDKVRGLKRKTKEKKKKQFN
jgi:hypothetical protein